MKNRKKAKAIFPICAKCETEIALRVGTAIVRVVVVVTVVVILVVVVVVMVVVIVV